MASIGAVHNGLIRIGELAHYEKLLEESGQQTWTTEIIDRGAAERLLPVIMTPVFIPLSHRERL